MLDSKRYVGLRSARLGRVLGALAFLLSCGVATAARGQENSISLSAGQVRLGRLSAGHLTANVTFTLDEADTISIETITSVTGVTTTLQGPHGEVINSSNIGSLGGQFSSFQVGANPPSEFLLPTGIAGFHSLFTFPSSGPGDYKVLFQGPSSLTQDVVLIAQANTDSPAVATLLIPSPVVTAGDPVALTVPFFKGSAAVLGATVKATILPPSGSPVTVTLLDDGGAVDDQAHDGLYSGQFTSSVPGEYQVAVSAQSPGSGGTPCIREAGGRFKAVAPSAKLTGAVSDRGEDDNGNGLFDQIVLDVGVNVIQAGPYQAFVELTTAGGQHLRRSAQATLAAGSGTISVGFDAPYLRSVGENGPFEVDRTDLVFLSSQGAVDADSRTDGGMTGSYLLSQLEQPLVALSGTNSDQGIDDDGNGLFDELRVRIGVDIAVSGLYAWSLKLTDANLRELNFAAGSGFLEAGAHMLEVSFKGQAIGKSGANGPYQLRDLLISGPASLVHVEVGQTQSYRASQFESFSGSSCVPGPTAMCLNGGRFKVEVQWQDFQNGQGQGQVVPFGSADSGLFWFFAPANWEMLVKVLDGCALGGNFWVFAAATTNVAYTLKVTDTQTGMIRTYTNPLGRSAPALTDTSAFPTCSAIQVVGTASRRQIPQARAAAVPDSATPVKDLKATCVIGAGKLCLSGGRFQVTVDWRDFQGNQGSAQAVPFGSTDSGLFWFFDANNWEMLVKVLDACAFNQRFWVFSAATTNVEYTLHVLDTRTGTTKNYHNALGKSADAITDTNASATCQ